MNKNSLLIVFNRVSAIIDAISEWTGKLVAWLILTMVLLVSYDVTMRYFFRSGSVALQEMEWHLFSLIFLLGAAYTLKHDDHVRSGLQEQLSDGCSPGLDQPDLQPVDIDSLLRIDHCLRFPFRRTVLHLR